MMNVAVIVGITMIYLLRHGEIVGGNNKRYIGQIDVPLSEKGRDQAAWWKKKLSRIDFAAVCTSDLIRAFDTAAIVSGLPAEHIRVLPALREISLGDWEGASMETIRTRCPEDWAERGRQMDSFRVPKGESFQDLHDRVIPLFLKIVAGSTGNVLLVAHACVNRVILCHVLGKPVRDLFSIPQDYAALNLIDTREGGFSVLALNRTPETISFLGD